MKARAFELLLAAPPGPDFAPAEPLFALDVDDVLLLA